ncbi:MAG: RNA-binding S4 domain-containing protein [Bacteroidales bacterium]|jgi:23S rRNA pseudouridine2605 synthase|nr:RNA-binding S4 domain-containing protein [Bacteroidales bacterium]
MEKTNKREPRVSVAEGDSTGERSERPARGGERKSYSDRPARKPYGERKSYGDRTERKPYGERSGERKSYGDRPSRPYGERKPYGERSGDSAERKPYGERKSYGDRTERKPYGERSGERKSYSDRPSRPYGERKPYGERSGDSAERKPYGERGGERKSYSDRPSRPYGERKSYSDRAERKSYGDRPSRPYGERGGERGERGERGGERKSYGDRPSRPYGERKSYSDRAERKPYGERGERGGERGGERKSYSDRPSRSYGERAERPIRAERSERKTHGESPTRIQSKGDGFVRLNKYIANAGVCSRREADILIASGAVKVNGEICTVLGTKVGPDDVVNFGGETLKDEKKVYILMNKPKGFITTVDDPNERKTVMELFKGEVKERVYPVGRLDRNTTGVLLFTNDGDLAKKLTHPSHGARKVYEVTLDKPLTKTDMKTIAKGIELEDGPIQVDEIQYVKEGDKTKVGVQIHSGRNRIIRRIFESLGYDVTKLDRSIFVELTKKNLTRGAWRFLTEQEVNFLKQNS